MNTIIRSNTAESAAQLVNKERLANKNKWLFLEVYVGNQAAPLLMKSFNTSIQILKHNEIRYSDGMDLKPTIFQEKIRSALLQINQ